MAMPSTLDAWLEAQQTLHGTPIDMGLERVREVAQRLGLLPVPFRTLTVAGTNGKGSTTTCLTELLLAGGHHVGTFTSPHLLRYNERIRVDGQMAADEELMQAFATIETARGGTSLTFFEFNLLAALCVFRTRGVDFAVLEVGLGGRLDAVNIVDADAAIVCSIGFDHRDWLGDTLEAIGREKAGVFRAGRPAIVADPAMVGVVEAEALRLGARPWLAQRDYHFAKLSDGPGARWRFEAPGVELPDLPPPALQGDIQYANAAGALAALAALQPAALPPAEAVAQALGRLSVPGRFQVVPGAVEYILDVAHNEPAAQVLAANLASRPVPGRTLVVAGILGDKDIDAVARALQPVTDQWILCGIAEPRGLTATELAARSAAFAGARLAIDVEAGLALARSLAQPGDRVVVCGSFLTVAPALRSITG
jgi:dihydrofolate synthase / folylpolyglutamate synthase